MKQAIIAVIALFVVMTLLGSWIFMILIGNVHASLIPALPAIGFRDSMSIVLPLSSIIAYMTAQNRE